MKVGVILAGGLASRLPHKPLLPMKDGLPVICSSVKLLFSAEVQRLIVVVPPFSVIPMVLRKLFPHVEFSFVTQYDLTGVSHAAGLVAKEGFVEPHDQLIITCCDNIYGEADFTCVKSFEDHHARVMNVPEFKAIHLAKVMMSAVDHWYNSSEGKGICFAGWWQLRAEQAERAHPGESTVDFFNRIKVRACRLIRPQDTVDTSPGWWDIGTPETYYRYWLEA